MNVNMFQDRLFVNNKKAALALKFAIVEAFFFLFLNMRKVTSRFVIRDDNSEEWIEGEKFCLWQLSIAKLFITRWCDAYHFSHVAFSSTSSDATVNKPAIMIKKRWKFIKKQFINENLTSQASLEFLEVKFNCKLMEIQHLPIAL